MKKAIILFLALSIAALGAALPAAASQPGKLLIWADAVRTPVLKTAADAFTKEYKVPVDIVEVPFGDIRGKLATAGPAGEGPDIIVGPHDWLGELVANGLISPIVLSASEKANFVPVTLEAFTYNGKLYGLPYAMEAIALIYNKKMVPTPPKTFEELIAIAKKLTDKKKGTYGFMLPGADAYHSYPIISAYGGYIFGHDANGNFNPKDVGLDSPGAIKGAQLIDRLVKEGVQPKGADYNTMANLFKEGKLGMMITGPWEIGNAKAAKINYGVTKIPTIEGKTPKPFVGVQGFMVSAHSKNSILANEFLKSFMATKEMMLALYKQDPRIPAYKPALDAVDDNPDLKAFAASAANGEPMPSIPEMAAVWGAYNDKLSLILNGEQAPDKAMKDMAAQVRKAIEGGK